MPPAKRRKRAAPAKKSRKTMLIMLEAPAKCFLIEFIPTEVHMEIFSYLDPVTSICLGLTCMQLYAVHRIFFPNPVDLPLTVDVGEPEPAALRFLIDKFFVGKGLLYTEKKQKFVSEMPSSQQFMRSGESERLPVYTIATGSWLRLKTWRANGPLTYASFFQTAARGDISIDSRSLRLDRRSTNSGTRFLLHWMILRSLIWPLC
ncbi:hypothetical protein N431DRAFT_564554 [Stipitochalara longipes BDJ]|nr:hypothetical protein N431DRAFT_564554 [Stipitochalara longipes BDJ]